MIFFGVLCFWAGLIRLSFYFLKMSVIFKIFRFTNHNEPKIYKFIKHKQVPILLSITINNHNAREICKFIEYQTNSCNIYTFANHHNFQFPVASVFNQVWTSLHPSRKIKIVVLRNKLRTRATCHLQLVRELT